MTAEDGYIIAAHHPTVEVSFGGVFLRNTDTGRIEIMGGFGPVSNLAVASFIDPMGGNGFFQLGKYDLRDQSGQSVTISSEGQPGGCDIWDCRAVGYSAASLGYSIAGDAGILCTAATVGACSPVMIGLKAADAAVTFEAARYTVTQHALGNASDADLAVSLAETSASIGPGAGIGTGVASLLWNIFDPIIPDERWGKRGSAR